MTLEPCPACDNPRCYGRCPANQRAIEMLRRLWAAVVGLEDGSIKWPVWFSPRRVEPVIIDVEAVLDETTVGVLFEPPDKVRYLKKRERVGAVVPGHFVEDEHE